MSSLHIGTVWNKGIVAGGVRMVEILVGWVGKGACSRTGAVRWTILNRMRVEESGRALERCGGGRRRGWLMRYVRWISSGGRGAIDIHRCFGMVVGGTGIIVRIRKTKGWIIVRVMIAPRREEIARRTKKWNEHLEKRRVDLPIERRRISTPEWGWRGKIKSAAARIHADAIACCHRWCLWRFQNWEVDWLMLSRQLWHENRALASQYSGRTLVQEETSHHLFVRMRAA